MPAQVVGGAAAGRRRVSGPRPCPTAGPAPPAAPSVSAPRPTSAPREGLRPRSQLRPERGRGPSGPVFDRKSLELSGVGPENSKNALSFKK